MSRCFEYPPPGYSPNTATNYALIQSIKLICLKEELDQLRRGMLVCVNPVELMTLKQQLEEGQVKMQSRLDEEEEAKVALMSRIQRLTKLILVSSKNSIPGYLVDVDGNQISHSSFEDKMDSSMLIDGENQKDPSADTPDLKHRRSSSKWNDDTSQAGIGIAGSAQMGKLIYGLSNGSKLPIEGISMSNQMDLLVEQVKMLAGEIAFSTSTLKRLVEQSVNDPESSKTQVGFVVRILFLLPPGRSKEQNWI